IGADVGRKVEIRKSVVIDVADGDAAAVVVVEVVQDVEGRVFGERVGERDSRPSRREKLEQMGLVRLAARNESGRRRQDYTERAPEAHEDNACSGLTVDSQSTHGAGRIR